MPFSSGSAQQTPAEHHLGVSFSAFFTPRDGSSYIDPRLLQQAHNRDTAAVGTPGDKLGVSGLHSDEPAAGRR